MYTFQFLWQSVERGWSETPSSKRLFLYIYKDVQNRTLKT